MTIDPKTIAIYDDKTNEYAAMTEGVPHDLVRFHDYLPNGGVFWIMGAGQAPQPHIWQNRVTLQMPLMHLKRWWHMRKNIQASQRG